MIAKQVMPMTGVMNISSAGAIEMKVIETPASVPSSAARGVILRMIGPTKPPIISTKLWMNTQVSPASQPLIGSPVFSGDRQHDHEGDDEHVRHADARGQRADIGAPGLLREPVGQPRVIERGQAQHQPGGRQDAAEDEVVRHLQHEAQQRGQREQVDEDVGAEAEEGVPVSGHPEFGFAWSVMVMVCVQLVGVSRRTCELSASAARMFVGVRYPAEDAALRLDHLQAHRLELGEIGADAVLRHEAVVAAVVGFAHGGVHADLGGHAGDDELRDAAVLQDGVQVGGEERALARLVDHRLATAADRARE